jgi:hypothetical protein
MAGRAEHAREVFERAITHVNELGLLAEEVDPHSGELLGNFPQAFSHIGLVMQPGRWPRQSNRHRYRHNDLPPHSPALTAWPPNCWRMVAISRSA